MTERTFWVCSTVVGPVTVICDGEYIVGLRFGRCPPEDGREESTCLSERCFRQLEEYLAGGRQQFDLPLRVEGTVFQKKVWRALLAIPFGETCCYADIAVRIGHPKACRAVGAASHNNPIPVVIPCHRVIGKNGDLTGYAGGIPVKKYLLNLEKTVV